MVPCGLTAAGGVGWEERGGQTRSGDPPGEGHSIKHAKYPNGHLDILTTNLYLDFHIKGIIVHTDMYKFVRYLQMFAINYGSM